MTEEEKEAIKNLQKLLELRKNKRGEIKFDTCICSTKELDIALNLIQKQQEEKEKKDKIIDEMANYIYSVDYRSECGDTRKQVKQYFERKV